MGRKKLDPAEMLARAEKLEAQAAAIQAELDAPEAIAIFKKLWQMIRIQGKAEELRYARAKLLAKRAKDES